MAAYRLSTMLRRGGVRTVFIMNKLLLSLLLILPAYPAFARLSEKDQALIEECGANIDPAGKLLSPETADKCVKGINEGSPEALITRYSAEDPEAAGRLIGNNNALLDLKRIVVKQNGYHAAKALEQLRVNLTLEQWKLCARDHTMCICQYFLFNTAGWVPVRELSAATGFRPEAVRKAVKALAAGGLLKLSGDRVRSPFAEKLVAVLPSTPATAGIRSALCAHLDKWLEKSKRIDGEGKRITVRMSSANLDIYMQHLQKAVNMAAIYDNSAENRRDSAVYIIDSSVVRIFPKALPK